MKKGSNVLQMALLGITKRGYVGVVLGLKFPFFSRTLYWLFSSLLSHSSVLILIIYYIFFIWNAKYLSIFWVVAYNMWWNLFLLLFVKRVSIWVVVISKEIKIWFTFSKINFCFQEKKNENMYLRVNCSKNRFLKIGYFWGKVLIVVICFHLVFFVNV